jgi:pimeloyl-ACP methyl ester carboxylesterase
MRHFRVHKRALKKLLAENGIPLTVIVGKRDSIIALSAVKKLVRDLPGAQLHLLNKSHFLIDGSIVRLIK